MFKMDGRFVTEGGGHMVFYRDEEIPEIRKRFEADLKKNGAPLLMPSVKELTALEVEAEKRHRRDATASPSQGAGLGPANGGE